MTLEQEQAAFEAQLDELMREHAGQVVLFKDGNAVGFYPDHSSAYTAGLQRFGLGSVFLVAPVQPIHRHPVSFAWQAGVMVG